MASNTTLPLHDGIVLFAGAGCSMAPPASLPGWNSLNDAILDTLWDMLPQYGIKDQFREKILGAIRQKRSENILPPDYQAQRMAERAGIRYFELLSAVDSETWNAVQYYAALLARTGIIKAVVTTNFDRHFERAFEAAGVAYTPYYDVAGFHALAAGTAPGTVPIIKIHGSCEAPASMIDTRQQRLQGRAQALQQVLNGLVQQYHFVFGGFSGADFDEDRHYLGFWDAATAAKGFTYLYLPGGQVRPSMQALIEHYGTNKATAHAIDPSQYLADILQAKEINYEVFNTGATTTTNIRERLQQKVAALEPMDALNMLTALAESYGDELSARYLYDKVWHERLQKDYAGEALSRFLLNHGRSYVFNFEDKKERAADAGIFMAQSTVGDAPEEYDEIYTNPAKMNLRHTQNTSPETPALIALVQNFLGNPILFKGFPDSLTPHFHRKPTASEMADIVYYYSYYALIYGNLESVGLLHYAIHEMETVWDEPRLSQLLSRRALLKMEIDNPEVLASAKEDMEKAGTLADKYHEPALRALASLTRAVHARKQKQFEEALHHIQEAESRFAALRRIPQYVECAVEYLKILLLGFSIETVNKSTLLQLFQQIDDRVSGNDLIKRASVYEPEYCYHGALIIGNYTNAPRAQVVSWFADALYRAELYDQQKNVEYYRESCGRFNILNEVEAQVEALKKQTA